MKTNAQAKTILKAVELVSKEQFEGNVVFRREPEKLTKNVLRFTLRTKDATKIGSIVTKEGQRQPKANWEVHEAVMKKIFELEPKPNVFVDTIYGRQHNNLVEVPVGQENSFEPATVETKHEPEVRQKRKYTRRKGIEPTKTATVGTKHSSSPDEEFMDRFATALKALMLNPELLNSLKK